MAHREDLISTTLYLAGNKAVDFPLKIFVQSGLTVGIHDFLQQHPEAVTPAMVLLFASTFYLMRLRMKALEKKNKNISIASTLSYRVLGKAGLADHRPKAILSEAIATAFGLFAVANTASLAANVLSFHGADAIQFPAILANAALSGGQNFIADTINLHSRSLAGLLRQDSK